MHIYYIIIYFISIFHNNFYTLKKTLVSFSIMIASINGLLHDLNKPRNIYLCVKVLERMSFLDTLMKMGTTYIFEKNIYLFSIKSYKKNKVSYISSKKYILHMSHILIYPMKIIGGHKGFRAKKIKNSTFI